MDYTPKCKIQNNKQQKITQDNTQVTLGLAITLDLGFGNVFYQKMKTWTSIKLKTCALLKTMRRK